MKLSELGERKIIHKYVRPLLSRRSGNILLDDCAVLNLDAGRPYLFSTDQGPNRSFLDILGVGAPADLADFHVTLNVSDIAAMGGTPIALLLVFAARPDDSEEYVASYFEGLKLALKEYKVSLIGGDTKQSSVRSTTITIIGRSDHGPPLLRKGASAGDQVFITEGLVGECLNSYIAAARGAGALQHGLDRPQITRPRAKIAFGQTLARAGIATACMDMSDGLLASAEQLADINRVTFQIEPDLIEYAEVPTSNEADQGRWRSMVLNVGGDFGLMFTVSPSHAHVAERLGGRYIGRVLARQTDSLDVRRLEEKGIQLRSWEQFSTVNSISDEILSFLG